MSEGPFKKEMRALAHGLYEVGESLDKEGFKSAAHRIDSTADRIMEMADEIQEEED